ncbi:hypothetical protein G8O18_13980 [Enterobacter kobei]|uniref:hypothetical protein n=1 Tax=Enterobacter kobei TaxID=208224 RepID=UPI002F3348A6
MKRALLASLLFATAFNASASALDTAKDLMRESKQYAPMFKQLNQGEFKKITSNMKKCKANTEWYEDEFFYVAKQDKCTEENSVKLKKAVAQTKEIISMQEDYGRFYTEFETKIAMLSPRINLFEQEFTLENQIGELTVTKKQIIDVLDAWQETIASMSASNSQNDSDLKNVIQLMYSLNHKR